MGTFVQAVALDYSCFPSVIALRVSSSLKLCISQFISRNSIVTITSLGFNWRLELGNPNPNKNAMGISVQAVALDYSCFLSIIAL